MDSAMRSYESISAANAPASPRRDRTTSRCSCAASPNVLSLISDPIWPTTDVTGIDDIRGGVLTGRKFARKSGLSGFGAEQIADLRQELLLRGQGRRCGSGLFALAGQVAD